MIVAPNYIAINTDDDKSGPQDSTSSIRPNTEITTTPQTIENMDVVAGYATRNIAVGEYMTTNRRSIQARDEAYEQGYDTEGEMGPFMDAIEDESSDDESSVDVPFGYECVDETDSDSDDDEDDGPAPIDAPLIDSDYLIPEAPSLLLTESAILAMTVNQLKNICRWNKLAVSGKKSVIQARIKECLDKGIELVMNKPAADNNEMEKSNDKNKKEVKWSVLEADKNNPINVNNSFDGARQPTDPQDINTISKSRYSFIEIFDRPDFTGRKKIPILRRNKTKMRDKQKNIMYDETVMKEGHVREEFLKTNNLNIHSTPTDWINAFIGVNPTHPKSKVCLTQWVKYTNHKAILMGAGPSYVPFTVEEMKKFIGLFVLHGLSPSPQIQQKFKPQSADPVNGNDLVFHAFGRNAEKRLKEFKRYFAVCDPAVHPPSKKDCPNWKVQEFLSHMNIINQHAWVPGKFSKHLLLFMLIQYYVQVHMEALMNKQLDSKANVR